MTKTKIEACPFCGDEGVITETHVGHFHIECDHPHCRARIQRSEMSPLAAVTVWNKREGGQTLAASETVVAKAVGSSELLGVLHERFSQRATECESFKRGCITKGLWHEAHESGIRKGIWLSAAEMVSQEESTPNDSS